MSAKDKGTGKEQKIRIEASSGLSDEEIEKMKQEAQANAETDKIEKEKVFPSLRYYPRATFHSIFSIKISD